MDNNTTAWVCFRKPGVPYGYSHFEGDVCELSTTDAEKLTDAGAVRAAKPAEIEKAKAAIVADLAAAEKARTATPEGGIMALLAEIGRQKAELDAAKVAPEPEPAAKK